MALVLLLMPFCKLQLRMPLFETLLITSLHPLLLREDSVFDIILENVSPGIPTVCGSISDTFLTAVVSIATT